MDQEKKENPQQTITQTPKKLWRKPDLQKLHVSLDTAATIGSGGDGMGQTTFG